MRHINTNVTTARIMSKRTARTIMRVGMARRLRMRMSMVRKTREIRR
jgi:hypothetical protein